MIRKAILFLKLIRFPNLLITGLALWMHWHYLLRLPIHQAGWEMEFGSWSLFYLSLAFAMLMGAGFIINDIYDMDIDAINKGDKRIVGNHITVRQSWFAFWVLILLAATISFTLAYNHDKLKYLWIYPAAAALLVIYSVWLKKTTLVGNILIALLCGSVLLIPLLAESSSVLNIPGLFRELIYKNFMICWLVACMLTLTREIVKDIEDVPGDQAAGAKTLPIRNGLPFAKNVVGIIVVFTMSILIIQVGWGPEMLRSMLGILIGFILPLAVVLYLVYKSREFKEFRRVSTLLKLIMVAGMILLPMLLYYQYSWSG